MGKFKIKVFFDNKSKEIEVEAEDKQDAFAMFVVDVKANGGWINFEDEVTLTVVKLDDVKQFDVIDLDAQKLRSKEHLNQARNFYNEMNR